MLARKPALTQILLLAAGLATASIALAQAPPAAAKPLAYDIVSVKLSRPGTPPAIQFPPDGLHIVGMPLQPLIVIAYGFHGGHILGLPDWSDTRFDIDAKVDSSDVDSYAKLTADQHNLMREALLADRFKLKIHTQTREGPVYALVPAKDGSKLKVSTITDDSQCKVDLGRRRISVHACSILAVTVALSQIVGRTVIDKSGLTARYDFTLDWSADADPESAGSAGDGADPSGESIFTTIQEQLGLKLESQKGPVEDIVIDHVEMPSAN